MSMGDLRDREYRRYTVREDSVRALLGALATVSKESQPA
jgi:dsRNA-specific ribonuclease